MPRRWISLRGHKGPIEDDVVNNEFQSVSVPGEMQKRPPDVADEHLIEVHRVEIPRPRASSKGSNARTKTTFHAKSPPTRTQTSQATGSPLSLRPGPQENSKADLIGVAYGSPTHPPTNFYGALDSITPIQCDIHAFEQQGPFENDCVHVSKSRWKKFEGLFKNNKTSRQPQAESQVSILQNNIEHQDGDHDQSSTGARWSPRTRVSPNTMIEGRNMKMHDVDMGDLQGTAIGVADSMHEDRKTPNAALLASLPKLQVDIPSARMDRYTVMFGNVEGSKKSSDLLKRRSRALEHINANAAPTIDSSRVSQPDNSALLTSVAPARRQTSPALSRRSASYSLYPAASPAPSRASAGFSLFPNASSTTLRTPRIPRPLHSPLQRSATSPARMSPMHESFNIDKPKPLHLRKKSDKSITSPEQRTASTRKSSVWSLGTFTSPTSAATTVDDDILFDVRSFRDSRGLEGQQFEMTRPASTAVELYRSASKNTKARAPKRTLSREVNVPILKIGAGIKSYANADVQSNMIDETIKAVEKLAMPSVPMPLNSPIKPHIGHLIDASARRDGSNSPATQDTLPSPLFELRADPLTPTSRPEANSSLIAPPVPAKDSKFIPISKFAKNANARPAKQIRSVTESATLPSRRPKKHHSPVPASRSEESLTPNPVVYHKKPTRTAHLRPILHQHPPTSPVLHDLETPPVPVTTIPVIIQPAAEVSVARTISLSRKQSTRVLVKRGGVDNLRAGEFDDDSKEELEKRKTRMELLETGPFLPVVVEIERGHRVGKSINALIESA